jgi:hypothetical protein
MGIPLLPCSHPYRLATDSQLTNLSRWPSLYSLGMDRTENTACNSSSIAACLPVAVPLPSNGRIYTFYYSGFSANMSQYFNKFWVQPSVCADHLKMGIITRHFDSSCVLTTLLSVSDQSQTLLQSVCHTARSRRHRSITNITLLAVKLHASCQRAVWPYGNVWKGGRRRKTVSASWQKLLKSATHISENICQIRT